MCILVEISFAVSLDYFFFWKKIEPVVSRNVNSLLSDFLYIKLIKYKFNKKRPDISCRSMQLGAIGMFKGELKHSCNIPYT